MKPWSVSVSILLVLRFLFSIDQTLKRLWIESCSLTKSFMVKKNRIHFMDCHCNTTKDFICLTAKLELNICKKSLEMSGCSLCAFCFIILLLHRSYFHLNNRNPNILSHCGRVLTFGPLWSTWINVLLMVLFYEFYSTLVHFQVQNNVFALFFLAKVITLLSDSKMTLLIILKQNLPNKCAMP